MSDDTVLDPKPTDDTGTDDPGTAGEELEATETASVDDEIITPEPAAEAPKKGNLQKKFDKLTKDKGDLERHVAFLEGQASVKQEQPDAETVTTLSPAGLEPKPEDYEDHDEYMRASIKYGVSQGLAETKATEEAGKKVTDQAQNERKISKQYEASAEKHEDFEEIALNPSLPINQTVVDAAMGDNFAEILYALGKNPDEAARIASLPPLQAAREIGKIEAKITATPPKPKPKPSEAAETIDTISTGTTPATGMDITKMSQKERFALWEKDKLEKPARDHY